MKQCAQHADADSNGCPIGSPSPEHVLVGCLTRLAQSMQAQTEAINRLAISNEALVRAMAEADGMDDMPAMSYMDGSPVR